jgi:hypothetical protein
MGNKPEGIAMGKSSGAMTSSPIALAAGAKGPLAFLHRVGMIARRYALTPIRIEQALEQFVQTLQQFECSATFPTTAVAVERHPDVLTRYQMQGIEFAVHGYRHVDYAQLTSDEQVASLNRACEVFAQAGLAVTGFRSPYLRRESHLNAAIGMAGLSYVSNQPIMWDVLDAGDFTEAMHANYQRALAFYDPWHAAERPSLPRLDDGLVAIPVSLPDDEILLDRLGGGSDGLVGKAWQQMLIESHQRGELFTLQLHPERIAWAADGLAATLTQARALNPSVWIARLDEIAAWWRARTNTMVEIADLADGGMHVTVAGPDDVVVLARGVEVDACTRPWADGYQWVESSSFSLRNTCRPFIGLSPGTSDRLVDFLRQQGYIAQVGVQDTGYAYYLDQAEFSADDERPLLAQLEDAGRPLVRLGRWPNGAYSALAITGDIDAFTLWDYALRTVGR